MEGKSPKEIVAEAIFIDNGVKNFEEINKIGLRSLLNASELYMKKVNQLENELHQSKLKFFNSPRRYKDLSDHQEAQRNAEKTKAILLEGMDLLYSIREKITGQKITIRTLINTKDEEGKKSVSIVDIPYEDFLGNAKLTRLAADIDILKNALTFSIRGVREYNNNLMERYQKDAIIPPPPNQWLESTKTLYMYCTQKWRKRNPKPKKDKEGNLIKQERKDSFNQGHIFEHIDRLNLLRVRSLQDGQRGVVPWKEKSGHAEADYLFRANAKYGFAKSFDSIHFLKGGDVLATQDKLTNGHLASLSQIKNAFEGIESFVTSSGVKTQEIKGVIPVLKGIVTGKDPDVVNSLLDIFSKKNENLDYDIIQSASKEEIIEIEKVITERFSNITFTPAS